RRHVFWRKSSEILSRRGFPIPGCPPRRAGESRGGRQDQAAYKLRRKGEPATGRTSAYPGNDRSSSGCAQAGGAPFAYRKIGYEEEEEAAVAKLRLDRLDVFEKVRPMKPKL